MFRSASPRLILISIISGFLACQSPEPTSQPAGDAPADEGAEAMGLPAPPAGFDDVRAPADNPTTPEKVNLGRQLFFDARLSADGTRSCYSCHVCEHGLTDGLPLAQGALGRQLTRSSPPLWNIGYHTEFYWDGRSSSLEAQAKAAWTGGNMGADAEEIVATLNGIDGYTSQFQEVFGEAATPDNVAPSSGQAFFAGTARTISGAAATKMRREIAPNAAPSSFWARQAAETATPAFSSPTCSITTSESEWTRTSPIGAGRR